MNSGSALLAFPPNIVPRPARRVIGNLGVTGNFARNSKLNAAVSHETHNIFLFVSQLISVRPDMLDGIVPGISSGDFDFLGTLIEAEHSQIKTKLPEIFRTMGKKLVIIMLDFLVCPPTRSLMPPENFNFCEKHYSEPLRAKWHHLRENMDTLVHPTVVFCAHIQRGPTTLPMFRVVTTTLKDEPQELIALKHVAGCTC